MNIKVCNHCGEAYYLSENQCPHCSSIQHSSTPKSSTAAILLGLSLTACDRITADPQPLYGVAFDTSDIFIDEDGDGYGQDEDCDDNDPEIHPDAEETPEDGMDSNCNNDDDT
mgnify:CR=1 FL=1|jgi:hypothetical protein